MSDIIITNEKYRRGFKLDAYGDIYSLVAAREDDGFANVEIAKHRGGPTLDIELKWDWRRMAFSNPD